MSDFTNTSDCILKKVQQLNRRELFTEMCKTEFVKIKHELSQKAHREINIALEIDDYDSKFSTSEPVVAKLIPKSPIRPATIVIYRLPAIESTKNFSQTRSLISSSIFSIIQEYML